MDTPRFRDGQLHEHELTPGPIVTYPFKGSFVPDLATKLYERHYQVARARYRPKLGLRTAGVPDRDPADATAYLAAESDPVPINGQWAAVKRVFANIPGPQVNYPGSRYFTKPDYTPDTAFNPFDLSAKTQGPATDYPTWSTIGSGSYSAAFGLYVTGDSKLYNPLKVPSTQTVGYATAGTFTLSYGASTTDALAYNTGDATIAAALNGLASIVAAGLTVGVGNFLPAVGGGSLALALSDGTDAARLIPITMGAGSLTVTTSAHPTTTVIGVSQQRIYLPTHLAITAHGFDPARALAAVWGNPVTFIYPAGYWGVIDANTIWLPGWSNNLYAVNLVGTYASTYAIGGTGNYAGGIRLVRTRVTETFYLPGVSAGIASPADIVPPAGMQNPVAFLAALLTPLSGYQIYENEGPAPWMGGPIYRVATTEINFDDLV